MADYGSIDTIPELPETTSADASDSPTAVPIGQIQQPPPSTSVSRRTSDSVESSGTLSRITSRSASVDLEGIVMGARFKDKFKSGFGSKTLGFWSSCCLNLNNCMGPAMVLLPLVSQQAGWFTPTLAMLVVFTLSSFAATMLCEAMQRIPGNYNFSLKPRVEFTSAVKHYYGKKWYYVFQFFFTLSLQALNVASMIISAQVVDNFIFKICGKNYALNYTSWTIVEACSQFSHDQIEQCIEDSNVFTDTWVISLGYLISMVICLPFGVFNLDDNMWFQWFSLIGLLTFTLEFIVQFFLNIIPGSHYNIPPGFDNATNKTTLGLGPDLTPAFKIAGQGYVFGLSTFAYAYVVTIPSWVNEKKPEVSVNKAVWLPALIGLFMKVAVGLLGGMSFFLLKASGKPSKGADNILIKLLSNRMPKVTQYSAYLWNLTTIIPGIPVLGIYVRYNLLAGKICGRFMSAFWGVMFPWIVTVFLYETSLLQEICNWIALLAAGLTNFIVPAMLYYKALKMYPRPQPELDTLARGEESPLLGNKDTDLDPIIYGERPVNAVPDWIARRISPQKLVAAIAIFFTVFSTLTIIFYFYGYLALGVTD